MNIDLLIKIIGIGLIAAVAEQLLAKAGKNEFSMLISLVGLVLVLTVVVPQISELFDLLRSVFGL